MTGRTGGKELRSEGKKKERRRAVRREGERGKEIPRGVSEEKKRAADRPSGEDARYGETRGAEQEREMDREKK